MARDTRTKAAELLTVRQVLDELGGISRRTFYRWRELRLAPACIRLPNGELRVRRDVLNDWLEERAEGWRREVVQGRHLETEPQPVR